MKKLLWAKRTDLFLQLLAVVIPFEWALVEGAFFTVLAAYLSVGGVQILSCIANKLVWPGRLKHRSRHKYEKLLLAVAIIEGIALLLYATADQYSNIKTYVQVPLGALPFFSPFMAIWYMVMTREELVVVRSLVARAAGKARSKTIL